MRPLLAGSRTTVSDDGDTVFGLYESFVMSYSSPVHFLSGSFV
jgi:hypothetical protein